MRYSTKLFTVIAGMFLMFGCSEGPVSPDIAYKNSETGSADVTIQIGKIGSLSKIADITMDELVISLSAPEETPIFDTININSNGSGTTVLRTYSNLASLLKSWTLQVVTKDTEGKVVHAGSTKFVVQARKSTPVNLTLDAKFSMLKANFFPVRDSVTRCELLVNGVKMDDSSFAKQILLGDTIRLSYNYLDVDVAQRIKLNAYGTMWGFDTLLYTGDTTIVPVAGADKGYSVKLKWVGPAKPPAGQSAMSVVFGPAGTIVINGELESPVPTDSLLVYYPFDNLGDLNILHDLGPLHHDQKIKGSASWVLGKIGGAFSFSGDDTINTLEMDTSVIPITLANSFTYSLWVNPQGVQDNTPEASSGVAGTRSVKQWVISATHASCKYDPGNCNLDNHAGAGVSVGQNGISVYEGSDYYLSSILVYPAAITGWTHIAVVYTDNRPSLYVDGKFVRTGLQSTRIVHPNISFSNPWWGGGYTGMLDEVRVYKRALTEAEVQALSQGR